MDTLAIFEQKVSVYRDARNTANRQKSAKLFYRDARNTANRQKSAKLVYRDARKLIPADLNSNSMEGWAKRFAASRAMSSASPGF